jgi:hypothetical protein
MSRSGGGTTAHDWRSCAYVSVYCCWRGCCWSVCCLRVFRSPESFFSYLRRAPGCNIQHRHATQGPSVGNQLKRDQQGKGSGAARRTPHLARSGCRSRRGRAGGRAGQSSPTGSPRRLSHGEPPRPRRCRGWLGRGSRSGRRRTCAARAAGAAQGSCWSGAGWQIRSCEWGATQILVGR